MYNILKRKAFSDAIHKLTGQKCITQMLCDVCANKAERSYSLFMVVLPQNKAITKAICLWGHKYKQNIS